MYKRREFLKLTGSLAGGLMLSPLACKLMPKEDGDIQPFGIQLYTLRDDLPKDPKGVLKEVSLAGYKQIESYEHDKLGMFWGMSNKDFKSYLDSIGLTIVSSHCDVSKDFEKKTADAAAIGLKYLIFAYEGSPLKPNEKEYKTMPKTIDEFKKLGEKFNQYGEICRQNGLKFGYHNHDYAFSTLENQVPIEALINNTDKNLVDFEMDIYWVVTAGQDPEAWVKKYPNRFRLCHIKDRKKGTTEREESVELGTGSINFKKVLKTARENGMQYFLVEQEKYDNSTPLKSMRVDAEYMKELKLK